MRLNSLEVMVLRKTISLSEHFKRNIFKNGILFDGIYNLYHSKVEKLIEYDLRSLIYEYSNKKSRIKLDSDDNNRTVWVMWWQTDDIPLIVEKNIQRMRVNLKSKVIFLNKKNIESYVTIPKEYYMKLENNDLSYATFSDFIRTELLYRYGGIWLDSTILTLDGLNDSVLFSNLPIVTIKGSSEYGNKFVSKSRWSIYCIGGLKGQIFFKFLNLGLRHYIEINRQPDYFLTDYLIDIAYNYDIDGIREKLDVIPNNNIQVEKLSPIMNKAFDYKVLNDLTKDTRLFKLTNKKAYITKDSNKKKTFYSYFFC